MPDDNTETLEQRIRSLCTGVVRSTSEEDLEAMCAELRSLLSQHIELVRAQVRELKTQELKIKKASNGDGV